MWGGGGGKGVRKRTKLGEGENEGNVARVAKKNPSVASLFSLPGRNADENDVVEEWKQRCRDVGDRWEIAELVPGSFPGGLHY